MIGRNAATHFANQPDTQVLGLSRRTPLEAVGIQGISVNLLDPEEVRSQLSSIVADVTHVVFAAYIERPNAKEKSEVNSALLNHLMDVLEAHAPGLQHITLYQGGKAYGADLGPFKTPAREDDPRLMPPNFYYDQEDILRQRQVGQSWQFTILRPEAVCGYAVGNPMNLLMVIAVYASISKQLGLPLRFPGPMAAYQALYQLTSAEILAEATDWAGKTDAAWGEIFNITNGDYFRWENLWPRIARMFEMEVAPPVPLSLAEYMADKGPVWEQIVEQYGLNATPYQELVNWEFGDFIFHSCFDNISSTIKARRAGFHACIDTEEMFGNFFQRLGQAKVIPVSSVATSNGHFYGGTDQ